MLILFGGFTALMLGGMPVAMALGGAVLAAMVYAGFGGMMFILPQQILDGVDNPALLAVPFFVMAGNLMNAAGMTDRIFDFAEALVGHLKAGLAQVVVVASMIFAGVSGAVVADLAGLGTVAVKAMRERGYSAEFASAVTLASSVVAPIIPPSIALILYSFLSNTSIARLFLAGLVPGMLIGASLLVFNRLLAIRHDFPTAPRAPLRVVFNRGLHGLAALVAPAIILLSIVGGFVTATEAGVLACGYSLLIGLAYRTLSFAKLAKALTDTMLMTAVIMMIIGFSTAMSWLLAIEQAPQAAGAALLAFTETRWVFLVILLVFLTIAGCLIEGVPAMLILVPMLLPICDSFGVDRVQFGLIFTMSIVYGIATPPMGIGLYIMAEVGAVRFDRLTVAILPFLVPLFVVLALVTFIPALTLWLPKALLGPY